MRNKESGFHSLSRQIVIQFCLFTVLISLVYSSISFVLMYTLEDSFIERGVLQEAEYLQTKYLETGEWPKPRSPDMQLYFSRQTFPEDIRQLALEEPYRHEFFGQEKRHYHLYTFKDFDSVFLIAEVGNQLLVRPIRQDVINLLIVSGLVVTFFACLIAWLLSRKTTRPLKQLAHLVNNKDADILPQISSEQFPNNEVGILAGALEQSLSRIASALKREKTFTRDVSHELRTPLAVIKNAVELSKTKASLDKENNDLVLSRINEAAAQMDATINTLLMLAREEHTSLSSATCQLMPIVEKSILDNRILLEDKPVEIEICDTCHAQIDAEANILKVVLDNILSNAFKYIEQGSISISYKNHTILLEDTGPGIDKDIVSNLTKAGVKGAQSTGFGFGLSIVKRLCEHKAWDLKVNSGVANYKSGAFGFEEGSRGTSVSIYIGK